MPAIGLLGIVAFALQIGVGFGVYRFLADDGRMAAAITGTVAVGFGIVSMFAVGLFLTLALDLVILALAALVGGKFERRPTPS
ncbi:hypothetical protein [Natrinema salsiterrestre]|uniref:Uncharacterized protein n=1 Tax=Natrinema salsiterrestre TaxID=2950540 RepID=A0A9Q4Q3D4_9EURY|nr:hypothetical protein [Natrinema salsiterrestre]MDF9746012.1 hypothetical protein [Natrinema salsiterrestre]